MVDMMMAFWTLTPISEDHPRCAALKAHGIMYPCSCPQFRHYHVCKHVIAFGLHQKTITVPLRFSSVAIGKRKAKAGASLSKRSRCLQIDN